jgi:hypothetical protein
MSEIDYKSYAAITMGGAHGGTFWRRPESAILSYALFHRIFDIAPGVPGGRCVADFDPERNSSTGCSQLEHIEHITDNR